MFDELNDLGEERIKSFRMYCQTKRKNCSKLWQKVEN